LFQALKENHRENNSIFCPLGADVCLGVLHSGAEGETKKEIEEVLGIGRKEHLEYLKTIIKSNIALIKNLFLSRGFALGEDFDRECTQYLETTFQDVMQIENITKWVNEWIQENTNGFLDGFDEVTVDPLTFYNLVYFKEKWLDEFEKARKENFITPSGNEEVDMMEIKKGSGVYHITNHSKEHNFGYDGARIKYRDVNASMICLMSNNKDEHIYDWFERVSKKVWLEIMNESGKSDVNLHMPKFEVESEYDLNGVIKSLGIKLPFDKLKANLSRINPNETRLFVDRTRQKARIKTDEKGTEAAAVTEMTFRSVNITPTIRFNRPFLYLVMDDKLNIPLFMGIVNNPNKK
jgi:serine protease inhibitor